jgi:hypothetical protein
MDEEKLIHELTSDEKLAAWGCGEWVEEPDYLEFTYREYIGIVNRIYYKHECGILELGHLCGYVQIPAGHPWHGKDYDEIEADCHGGLTYSGEKKEGLFFVGFDCAHSRDICPGTEVIMAINRRELQGKFPELMRKIQRSGFTSSSYKNMEYVKQEVMKLIDQAIEAKEIHE